MFQGAVCLDRAVFHVSWIRVCALFQFATGTASGEEAEHLIGKIFKIPEA